MTQTATARSMPLTRPMTGWFRLAGAVRLLTLARQRAALAQLDDARLADIGLDADQAMTEARRPFWDAPRHWR